ncbi:N-acetyl-gamma-glutamyl-phosphate reductase [Alicyclobacillus sp. SO9]|uniref:N-acetyl-gamma-glutamyl-phosphate reductase n=1 Tax=Alicyclobacillus sp. SO9 TaxID=2665646 RepID=UPI0018E79185|nr:N-acetyl-gamma-glutamyl-phosphate reductase [Alicyclobacillus sp. SO9]QQE80668.1 N-acetyl-gamma-glutamyl-phosphate reductase [Alicyclobacillus sp. SO9]
MTQLVHGVRVGIVGASGYSGAELVRILHHHTGTTVSYIAGNHSEDQSWSQLRPYLPGYNDLFMDEFDLDVCMKRCDVVFVALPSGTSGKIAAELWKAGMPVIDLSGDLRLSAAEYERWYKQRPLPDDALKAAVYGLTEWNRYNIREAKLVANPGCYATAILMGLKPLQKLEAVRRDLPILVDAKSGVTGAGRKPRVSGLYAELNNNFYAYKVGEHQHTPEIERHLGWKSSVLLTTQLLPMPRGIYASAYIHLSDTAMRFDDVSELYQSVYENDPFVTVHSFGTFPEIKHVQASNRCHIGLHVDKRTSVLQVFSVIDNLQKGASGQAVQNMNVMLGFKETEGLEMLPVYP